MPASVETFDVIVAGGGPAGFCTAIDLGRRGVKCLIMERNPATTPWPKMDRTNARSMEFFRRIGIAERIRKLGFPAELSMDVFLMTRLSKPPVAVLQFPSVAEWRTRIAATQDGSFPLEPYQLVAQNKVEPLLKEVAESTPNVTVRHGCEVTGFVQDDAGVTVTARQTSGEEVTARASYLVGCDGGVSTVRKQLDIKLEGKGSIREMRQVIFYSPDLFDKIPYGKGRHYSFLDPEGSFTIVVQGDRKEFTLHTSLPEGTDFKAVIAGLVGYPCDIKILHVLTWRHHLLLAERYRHGRVFLAGDSAHLMIPTGGLGMNTALGDAFDLSWKLAGVIRGWGGPALLDSYELERRPVGAHNVACSGWAAAGVPIWQSLVKPNVLDDTADGADLRHEIAKSFTINHGRMHGMRGAEFGYTYAGSAILDEESRPETWDTNLYTPHTRPGARAPHMWLSDGRPLQDVVGNGYTLLDFDGDSDTSEFEAAFRAIGAPLTVLRLDEPHMRQLYDRSMFLLRPDMHIAWRGDQAPARVGKLVDRVTGRAKP
jgi:2-polyprenyl-6-methoxyphenol hydroxylase-like FAD-dependent oxidoreductase